MSVYISWSSPLGWIATDRFNYALSTVFPKGPIGAWSGDAGSGADWFAENEKRIETSEYAVVLLLGSALRSLWQHYEVGRIRGQHKRYSILNLVGDAEAFRGEAWTYLHNEKCYADGVSRILLDILETAKLHYDVEGAHQRIQPAATSLAPILRSIGTAGQALTEFRMENVNEGRKDILMEQAVNSLKAAGIEDQQISELLQQMKFNEVSYFRWMQP